MSKKFEQQLAELGIALTQTQFNQFDKYYEMLVEWNKVMNLTGITEYEEVNEKHFVDSLALVKALDISKVQTVIDIGTGAGFPGIPLKIAFANSVAPIFLYLFASSVSTKHTSTSIAFASL